MSEQPVAFLPAKPKRAFDDIIDQVRELLRSGELSPGQKLPNERDFALQLGVSRNTVREALRMLEIAGLVTLKKGRTGGAFVTDSNTDAVTQGISDGLALTQFSIADLTEARIALESFIVRKAAVEITDEELDDLEASVARAHELSSRGDFPAVLQAHGEFHEKLALAARNPILASMLRPLFGMTQDLAGRIGPRAGEAVWEYRRRLIKALRDRDADAAADEVKVYLQGIHDTWLGANGN